MRIEYLMCADVTAGKRRTGTCPRRRPVSLSVLAAMACAAGCLPDAKMKIAYNDEPAERDDGWAVSDPVSEGLDEQALRSVYESFFSEDEFVTAISLLVVRHGKLVAEGYCRARTDIDQLMAIQSATKSVTSVLTGMAIEDGFIQGVEQRIFDIIPDKFDSDRSKRSLTIQDLLTMRTGLDLPNESFSKELLIDGQSDSLKYILHKPLTEEPGSEFNYIDGSPHLLAGVLQRAMEDRTLHGYARRRLFKPLGIERELWERYPDGVTYGAVGLYLTPRGLAKFGLLALNGGNWEGEQLVSKEWIEESTQPLVETDYTAKYGYRYGYYWWVIPELNAFTSDGHGGQFTLAVPDEELLVVMTAEPHTVNGGVAIELPEFLPLAARIIDAIED